MSELHVFDEGDGFAVWLDTEVAAYDGICIGTGESRQAALKDARNDLRDRLADVEKELEAQ